MLFRSELRTAVEHGVVLARGQEIELRDLPASVREGGGRTESGIRTGSHTVKLEELEQQAIETALQKTKQNVTEAAKLLGISRRTLHRKLADAKKG